jgi:hypothetical protein
MSLYVKLLSVLVALSLGAGIAYLGINYHIVPLVDVQPSQTPTPYPLPIETPTPVLIDCIVNGKTVYTTTQEDCSTLQQTGNSDNYNPPIQQGQPPPPCSLIPQGIPAPCVRGF